MRIFDAITVNDSTIKVDNRTDYYLDQWLYSDYGFRMFYKPVRGISEVYWNELLNEYKFDEPNDLGKVKFRDVSTRNRSIDFHEFLTRNVAIEFVSGDKFYCFFFDSKEWLILMTHDTGFWTKL
jgi:hypothetical protein